MEIAFITRFFDSSFHRQLRALFEGLDKIGIKWYFHDPSVNLNMAKKDVDYLVVWDNVYFLKDDDFYKYTSVPYKGKKTFLFYVSDTTRIGLQLARTIIANNFDAIITPTKWSANGFKYYGFETLIVPHAFYLPIVSDTREQNSVMIFGYHDHLRKGMPFAYSVVYQYRDKISHIFNLTPNKMKLKNEEHINVGSTCEQLAHIYSRTHYLVQPVFGGAFELNILECLSLGCVPIVPSEGAWMDFVRPEDAVLINSTVDAKTYYQLDEGQRGLMVHPSYTDLVEKMGEILEKPRFNTHAEYYQKEYSTENIARKFVSTLEHFN